jgi:hypothetical protein
MAADFPESDAIAFAKTDFAGIHQQLAAASSSFNTMLQIVIILEGLPWLAASALLARTGAVTSPLSDPLMAKVFCFSAFLGTVGYLILVYNRLLVIFYARALNGYRAMFAKALPVGEFLPIDSQKPRRRDSSGIMILVAIALGVTNALYLFLGVWTWSGLPVRRHNFCNCRRRRRDVPVFGHNRRS